MLHMRGIRPLVVFLNLLMHSFICVYVCVCVCVCVYIYIYIYICIYKHFGFYDTENIASIMIIMMMMIIMIIITCCSWVLTRWQ